MAWRRQSPPRSRPDLRAELAQPPRAVRRLPLRDAQTLVDLARAAMVIRARSLEAFSFADARDAWWVDDGDGLAYAFFGVLPERRHALAAIYGGLMLRNGVPIGYLQSDHVGRSAALSFNTFDSFRGIEAGFTFARWLAALRRLFGTSSFSIEPYQLGWHNDEAVGLRRVVVLRQARLRPARRRAGAAGPRRELNASAAIQGIAVGQTPCAGWPHGTCSSISTRRRRCPTSTWLAWACAAARRCRRVPGPTASARWTRPAPS